MDDIERRQSTRKRIAKEGFAVSQPLFTDEESVKEYVKKLKEHREAYQDACYLIDYDLDIVKRAFYLACDMMAEGDYGDETKKDVLKRIMDGFLAEAYDDVPMNAKDREDQELERERQRKAEEADDKAKRKAAGVDPEIEGQLKLPLKTKVKGDDGSCAEAASECVTKPLIELTEEEVEQAVEQAQEILEDQDELEAVQEVAEEAVPKPELSAASFGTSESDTATTADLIAESPVADSDEMTERETMHFLAANAKAAEEKAKAEKEAAATERRKKRLANRRAGGTA